MTSQILAYSRFKLIVKESDEMQEVDISQRLKTLEYTVEYYRYR